MKVGEHYIIEFIDCQSGLTNKVGIYDLLEQAVKTTNSTLVHINTHFFPISNNDMGGVSGIAILLESHISIHTWAEYNYVAIDIFTCGSHTNPANAIPILIDFFKPEIINIKILERGT